jgi:2-phospho-L-lactate guanylyltransferase
MKIAAVIPMKGQRDCKCRLAPALTGLQRQSLAAWMLERVVKHLQGSNAISEIFVLTSEEFPIPRGAARIVDPGRGLNAAIRLAGEHVHRRELDAILVLPGDVPLIQVADVDSLVAAARPRSWVLVPDKTGRGTNALLASPANLAETHFGAGSLARHREAAAALGINVVMHRSENLANDIDEPRDLSVLRAYFACNPANVPSLPISSLTYDPIPA